MTNNQQTISDYQQKLKDALKAEITEENRTSKWFTIDEAWVKEAANDLLIYGGEFKIMPEFKHIEHFGGEGKGEKYWSVFQIDDVYFRISGWYASYDGADIDVWDWEIVTPKQVQKTEWKAA